MRTISRQIFSKKKINLFFELISTPKNVPKTREIAIEMAEICTLIHSPSKISRFKTSGSNKILTPSNSHPFFKPK